MCVWKPEEDTAVLAALIVKLASMDHKHECS